MVLFSTLSLSERVLKRTVETSKKEPKQGDGSNPKRGTNSIFTGTKIVPVGPWGPRKIFLLSKMMNFQPQHIQKREIVDFEIIKYKCKS